MTSTPTSALQVECGQPPLELRRKRAMANYGLKTKCVPNHPTVDLLADRWTYYYGNFNKGREPFGVIVNEVLQRVHTKDISYLQPAMSVEAPGNKGPALTITFLVREKK